MKGIVDVIKNF